MTIRLVDTHAHLDMKEFAGDRDEVIARALAAGVTKIITVGTDIASSQQAIALTEKYPQVYAAVGVHPHDAGRVKDSYLTRLKELTKHPKVVAIGETGLDFYRNYSPKEAQFKILSGQLELAAELNLPIIIHTRQAAREMIETLIEWVKRHKRYLRQTAGGNSLLQRRCADSAEVPGHGFSYFLRRLCQLPAKSCASRSEDDSHR